MSRSNESARVLMLWSFDMSNYPWVQGVLGSDDICLGWPVASWKSGDGTWLKWYNAHNESP